MKKTILILFAAGFTLYYAMGYFEETHPNLAASFLIASVVALVIATALSITACIKSWLERDQRNDNGKL